MKKHIERIKANAKEELMKTSLVIVSTVGGLLLIKGVRKFTASHPTLDTIVKYSLPPLMATSGFLIAAGTEKDSKVKYIGYGLTAAGTIAGIRLIPVVGEYLSGITDDTDIPVGNAYYTEDAERQNMMQGLGDPEELPVGYATLQEAPTVETRLPELQGAEIENPVEGLGYNGDATSDVDDVVNGII